MATGNPIILGGGIGKGSPFTLGSLLRVANVTPPTAADSEVFQRTQGGVEVITVGTPWTAPNTVNEKLQVIGGFISDTGVSGGALQGNFVAGEDANCVAFQNARNVCIGFQAQCNALDAGASANTNLNVVITPITVVAATSGFRIGVGNVVLIGADPVWGSSFPGGNVVAIGAGLNLDVATTGPIVGAAAIGRGQGVAFGNFAGAQGNFNNWVCVGHSANINAANAMALGDGAQSSFTTSIALGRNALTDKANQLAIGGANLAINEMLVGEGLLSGGARADFTFRMTSSQGTDTPGGDWIYRASIGTGNAATKGSHIFQTGTPGASGVGGQAVADRLAITTPGTDGAAVDFRNVVDGAGAGAGTLTNAPTAGDPVFWLPILFNGAVGYVPVWQ